jgi:predicted glycosyltransferase involved in capsule biosynthesis
MKSTLAPFSNTTTNENDGIIYRHTENLIIMCDRDILCASMNRIDHTYIYVYIKEERGWLEL